MSDHVIIYDLHYPGNGTMECHAGPRSACHAVWDCGCEVMFRYGTKNNVPYHYTGLAGDEDAVEHTGKLDPGECSIRDWHENSDEDVYGTVVVDVLPDWDYDNYIFNAVSARVEGRDDA